MSRDEGKGSENAERIRQVLYKLAYKQLQQDEWKRLACNWAFTDEQIKAIEHQYTGRHHVIWLGFGLAIRSGVCPGPASYKEHGYRMLLIWLHGLPSDANPIKEVCDGLTTIDKKNLAGE